MIKHCITILAIVFLAVPVNGQNSEATQLLKERSEHLKPIMTKVSASVYTAS